MNTFGCVWKWCFFFPVFGHLSREDHDLSSNFGVSRYHFGVSQLRPYRKFSWVKHDSRTSSCFSQRDLESMLLPNIEKPSRSIWMWRVESPVSIWFIWCHGCVDIFWTLRIFETWNVIKGSMLKLWLLWYEPCSKPLIGGWLWRVLLPNNEYIKYSSSIFFGIPSSTTLGRSSKAASFDSAERAEWLVQLIHNLKRLPPNFWYSSAATGLLSLQIAQRLGVFGT